MNIDSINEHLTAPAGTSRRETLKRLGLGAAGLVGARFLTSTARAQEANAGSVSDVDIAVLQFALNLEYLEAEYYTYATTGHGIEQEGISVSGQGMMGPVLIKSNPQVPFSDPDIQQYAQEIGADERDHVVFIRRTLRAFGVVPVARPTVDLEESWNTLAQAAGLGSTFDPFANEVNFLLGAFVFEDVGVTAYRGAAPLLTNSSVLSGAAGLLGTEGYHAANIRTTLFDQHSSAVNAAARKISMLRDALDGADNDDEGILKNGQANIVPTNSSGLVFARTARQVLNILYGARGAHRGLFFPNGLNGTIT